MGHHHSKNGGKLTINFDWAVFSMSLYMLVYQRVSYPIGSMYDAKGGILMVL